jgi:hypothetical protein
VSSKACSVEAVVKNRVKSRRERRRKEEEED